MAEAVGCAAALEPPAEALGGAEDPPRRRGPDLQPRELRLQPHPVDRATGEAEADWTRFDVNRSLRTLRTGDEGAIRRELRKLHLRWWHAQWAPMERILQAAGVPRQSSARSLP